MQCQNILRDKFFTDLSQYIDSLDTKKGNLISVLHRAQEIFGYLPIEVQKFIAKNMEVPLAEVYGVITFYSFFTTKPRGKHPISICMGTACYVNGSEELLNEAKNELKISVGETTSNGDFSIDVLRCVGACGMAPVVMIGKKIFGKVEIGQIKTILKEYNLESDL